MKPRMIACGAFCRKKTRPVACEGNRPRRVSRIVLFLRQEIRLEDNLRFAAVNIRCGQRGGFI